MFLILLLLLPVVCLLLGADATVIQKHSCLLRELSIQGILEIFSVVCM